MRTTRVKKRPSRWLHRAVIVFLLTAIIALIFIHPKPVSIDNHAMTYGMALGSSVRTWSQDELDRNFQEIKDLGVTSIRYDIAWSALQPKNATDYDWATYDRIIETAQRYGLSSLVILDYTPRWARQSSCMESEQCPPKDTEAFARYSSKVVERYYPKGVNAYEIWNEPNSDEFWRPKADVAAYSRLFISAAQAVKRQAPDAVVLNGGLSPAGDPKEAIPPRTFLEGMYRSGVKDYLSGVAYHPYSYPFAIDNPLATNWRLMGDETPGLRSIMSQNGDGAKKVWITEYGAPTNGPGRQADGAVRSTGYGSVSTELQSTMAAQTVDYVASRDWIAGYYWYTLLDNGTDTRDKENFFGLIDTKGHKKPAYYQLQQSLKKLTK